MEILKKIAVVETLSKGNPNEIIRVTPQSTVVDSLETRNERTLFKNDFFYYLRILGEKTSLNPKRDVKESRFFKKSAIMCAIISQLPYVSYFLDPVVLYLVKV